MSFWQFETSYFQNPLTTDWGQKCITWRDGFVVSFGQGYGIDEPSAEVIAFMVDSRVMA